MNSHKKWFIKLSWSRARSLVKMCSLRGALTSTSRPWRPVYAYACYCLLPLSLALRQAVRTAFSGPLATATRSRAARWSTSGRLGWHHGSSSSALRLAPTSSSFDSSPRRLRGRSGCAPLADSFLGGASPLLVDCTRDFSSRRGARTRGGRALAMGKGLDRKKAKKSQVLCCTCETRMGSYRSCSLQTQQSPSACCVQDLNC